MRNIRGENLLERAELAGLRRRQERFEKTSSVRHRNRFLMLGGEPFSRAADELAACYFTGSDNVGNVLVWIVEGLTQHVRGSFRGGQPLEQEHDRGLEGFA